MAKFGDKLLGISNLFNDSSISANRNAHATRYIDIDSIDEHQKNRQYNAVKLEALALSIEDRGLQSPILVTPTENNRYVVLSGHRRLAAFRLLASQGKEDFRRIPAIVRMGLSEDQSEEALIDGNLFTEPLSPAELAKELARKKELLEQRRANGEKIPGKLTEIIASELGITPQTARELDTINRRAEPEIRELFEHGDLSQREAYNASRLPEERQRELAEAKKSGTKHLFPTKSKEVVHTPPRENQVESVENSPLMPLQTDREAELPTTDTVLPTPSVEAKTEISKGLVACHKIDACRLTFEFDGIEYHCIVGRQSNGGWVAILNLGLSVELSCTDTQKDAEVIKKALKKTLASDDSPQNTLPNNALILAEIFAAFIEEI